ncbi:uncharacterized protein E6C27_scaffold131G00950 [Cucumis melo var. makuwa]|uniref:Uncharacterized protein n=1 Tax=Cucumis melo var. makuwa TaxID=1194695 RepID=A0A5A7UIR5_CUCMM|nr:uncharacterized protein E6C27_scaffold131G00950 [Cucumis melo var. makuwa]
MDIEEEMDINAMVFLQVISLRHDDRGRNGYKCNGTIAKASYQNEQVTPIDGVITSQRRGQLSSCGKVVGEDKVKTIKDDRVIMVIITANHLVIVKETTMTDHITQHLNNNKPPPLLHPSPHLLNPPSIMMFRKTRKWRALGEMKNAVKHLTRRQTPILYRISSISWMNDFEIVALTQAIIDVFKNGVLEKTTYPESLTIPCSIGGMDLGRALKGVWGRERKRKGKNVLSMFGARNKGKGIYLTATNATTATTATHTAPTATTPTPASLAAPATSTTLAAPATPATTVAILITTVVVLTTIVVVLTITVTVLTTIVVVLTSTVTVLTIIIVIELYNIIDVVV